MDTWKRVPARNGAVRVLRYLLELRQRPSGRRSVVDGVGILLLDVTLLHSVRVVATHLVVVHVDREEESSSGVVRGR